MKDESARNATLEDSVLVIVWLAWIGGYYYFSDYQRYSS